MPLKTSSKTISFPSKNNETIVGILRQHNTTKPLVILCHGFDSSMELSSIKQISITLYELGYNTFTFNFSPGAQQIALDKQVEDIESIITFFSPYKEFIVMAGSFGALSAAIASSKLKNIKGLVTVNGFFGDPHLDFTGLKLYILFRMASLVSKKEKKLWNYMQQEFKPSKIPVPVLVIHSKADKGVSIKQSKRFYQALPGKKQFHTLEDADHLLTSSQSVSEVVAVMDKWLRELF